MSGRSHRWPWRQGLYPSAGAEHLPPSFAALLSRRVKHALGDHLGLKVRLAAGDVSARHHRHSLQEEFVYVLKGHPTLVADGDEAALSPGTCAGFPTKGPAHHLENRRKWEVLVLVSVTVPPETRWSSRPTTSRSRWALTGSATSRTKTEDPY